jgi:hypothetical protein
MIFYVVVSHEGKIGAFKYKKDLEENLYCPEQIIGDDPKTIFNNEEQLMSEQYFGATNVNSSMIISFLRMKFDFVISSTSKRDTEYLYNKLKKL